MNVYEWYPAFTTPENYDFMHVTGGYLTLEDDSKMPIHHGYEPMGRWGSSDSLRLVGPDEKYLPKQLNITWFSILENQAYQTVCSLPLDKIERYAENGLSVARPAGWVSTPFNRFISGIAPGGYVQVWAGSGAGRISIAYCQGKPTTIPFFETRLSGGGGYRSWDQYVQATFEEYTQQELQALKDRAFPVNPWRDIYTKRYPYTVKVTGAAQEPAYAKLSTFGGEYYTFGAPKTPADDFDTHGAPLMLDIFTLFNNGAKVYDEFHRVRFDEKEVLAAFEKFQEITQGNSFEMHAEVSDNKTHVNVTLTDGEHVYLFERIRME